MKILFISPYIPTTPKNGKGIAFRNYGFIRGLSKNNEVHLVSFYSDEDEKRHLRDLEGICQEIHVVKKRNSLPGIAVKILRSLFGGMPLRVSLWHSKEMENVIGRLLRDNAYDVIHISGYMMACYAEQCRRAGKTVIDFVDSKSLYVDRDLHSSVKKYLLIPAWEFRQVLEYEKRIMQKVRNIIYISRVDKEYMERHVGSGANISVVPIGYWQGESDAGVGENGTREKNCMAFVGDMGYLPNIDAMSYFCREIFPIIAKKLPDAKLYIIGRNPVKKIQDLAVDSRIIVTGSVDSVSLYLKKAEVFVCPMRIGSGLNTKILEAMHNGVPVVASRESNEGIWAEDGKELLLADSPEEFAIKIMEILGNKSGLSEKICGNAREMLRDKFEWDSVVRQLESVYGQL